jgi:hypothetical protein
LIAFLAASSQLLSDSAISSMTLATLLMIALLATTRYGDLLLLEGED